MMEPRGSLSCIMCYPAFLGHCPVVIYLPNGNRDITPAGQVLTYHPHLPRYRDPTIGYNLLNIGEIEQRSSLVGRWKRPTLAPATEIACLGGHQMRASCLPPCGQLVSCLLSPSSRANLILSTAVYDAEDRKPSARAAIRVTAA